MEPKTDVEVELVGFDGNAFYVLGKVEKALKDAGYDELAKQYIEEATEGDYDRLLQITMQYVHVE